MNVVSNSAPVMNAHVTALTNIRALISKSDEHAEGYRKTLLQALQAVFNLTKALLDADAYDGFVKQNHASLGKVAQGNPFQPITRIAFANSSTDPSSISKYAAVLLFASQQKLAAESLSAWIVSRGGINELAAQARQSSPTGPNPYVETREQHLTRAKNTLNGQTVASTAIAPSAVKSMPNSNGYGRAVVRVVNGQIEIVGFPAIKPEDIDDDILSLVPAQPKLASDKLSSTPFYDFFRLADMATRFMTLDPNLLLKPVDTASMVSGEGDFDTGSWLEAVKAKSASEKRVKSKGPDIRYGLKFEKTGAGWIASTISTAPTFAGIISPIELSIDGLDQARTYFISEYQLGRIARTFTEFQKWSLRIRKAGSTGGFDAGADGEIVLDVLDDALPWREFDTPISSTKTFGLASQRLQQLKSWREDYKRLGDKSARKFPGVLALSYEQGELLLQFPHLSPAGKAALPLERMPFGKVSLDKANQSALPDRWLVRDDKVQIAKLASDYGFSFEVRLLEMTEGHAAALAMVVKDNLEIRLPMAISLAGHRASIAKFVSVLEK